MATLKVTIKEELVLNGKDMGNENFLSIPGVTSAEHKVLSIGTSEQSVLLFAASGSPAAGTIIDDTVKHLRFTNLDSSNFIQLRLVDTVNTGEYFVKLEAGETFILGNSNMDALAATTDTGDLARDIREIYAKANTADCELEIFIATT